MKICVVAAAWMYRFTVDEHRPTLAMKLLWRYSADFFHKADQPRIARILRLSTLLVSGISSQFVNHKAFESDLHLCQWSLTAPGVSRSVSGCWVKSHGNVEPHHISLSSDKFLSHISVLLMTSDILLSRTAPRFTISSHSSRFVYSIKAQDLAPILRNYIR